MYTYKIKDLFRDNENIIVTRSQFKPNDRLATHKHECMEIAYVCSGAGYHIFNGEKHEVSEGDLFFISRNAFHTYVKETDDFAWINILFLPSAIEKNIFTHLNSDNVFKASFISLVNEKNISDIALYGNKNEFGNIILDMLTEYDTRHDNYQDVLRHYLQILLMKIFRLKPQIAPAADTYGNIVIDYLREHSLSEKLDVNALARTAFLSPRSFRDTFKKTTGKTLSQYLTDLRILRAKEFLENTDMPVLTVMNEVGYKDSKFFYEIFEHYTGLTPGEYRKKSKNENNQTH